MISVNAAIVDDEEDSIALLQLQLQKYCPQINVVATYTSSIQAAAGLKDIDLLFLDIEMPGLNGFELLEKLSPVPFKVIFITAYNEYAIKAFRFNALDYLLKPVDNSILKSAVDKAMENIAPANEQIMAAKQQTSGEPIKKIAVATHSGVTFITLDDVIYAEASGNYSKLILAGGNEFIISKTLKDIQQILEERHFFRVHRQFIINLNCVKQFYKNDNLLIMDNKAEIPVARIQKEKLIDKFNWL